MDQPAVPGGRGAGEYGRVAYFLTDDSTATMPVPYVDITILRPILQQLMSNAMQRPYALQSIHHVTKGMVTKC